jgi:hypothetical protein
MTAAPNASCFPAIARSFPPTSSGLRVEWTSSGEFEDAKIAEVDVSTDPRTMTANWMEHTTVAKEHEKVSLTGDRDIANNDPRNLFVDSPSGAFHPRSTKAFRHMRR